ncbi:uncharacterized protein LOC121779042 [Salvia splendens]|uniref:uncharacterized protein LOC121779042 n=1 Tax=Salvia splendens TaxID=180675 RepID=UPI001C256BA5|nr:uncharacterized protein LOC121779042 [Salvia splendens]
MGIDPNNGWWPIAWAVTKAESYVQWKWFVEYLSDDLNLHANVPRYVFMSDQQKGLAKVVVEEFSTERASLLCLAHIQQFQEEICRRKFQRPVVGDCREYHPRTLCGQDGYADRVTPTTSVPSGVAPKEKLHWLERKQVSACWRTLEQVKWKGFRLEASGSKATITQSPVIKELVDKWYARAASWRATWNGQSSYQVIGPSGQYVVNMRDFTCSYRLWQLTGIPCTHAIATINKNGDDVTRYVSRYYLKSTMIMLYENVIYLINGVDNWPKTTSDGVLELAPRGQSDSVVGETSQHNESRERGESTLPESSNNRRRQEPNVSDPGPSTWTKTQPQRCGRRGDQD